MLLDLGALADRHGFASLGAFAVSPDHRLLAFTLDTSGAERFTLIVKDIVSGEVHAHIPGALAVEWVPATERSPAAALMTSGQFLGNVCALLASPLAEWWWPSLFLLFGVAGLVWCVGFLLLATSTPQQHPRVSRAELAPIRAGRADEHADAGGGGARGTPGRA